MTTLHHTLLHALAAKDAGDGLLTANLLARVELSLGLLLDQLEADEHCQHELSEIAAAVHRFCPSFCADEIKAEMQRVIQVS
jgi:hypothetical protein